LLIIEGELKLRTSKFTVGGTGNG